MTQRRRQILLTSLLAVGLGFYCGGFTLDYRAFFVTTDGLQDALALPAIILGVLAGWWCWAPTLVFLFTTSLVLWLRAVMGRDIDLEYYRFAFAVAGVPVWEFLFQTILAAYLGAVFRFSARWMWKRIKDRFWPTPDGMTMTEEKGRPIE